MKLRRAAVRAVSGLTALVLSTALFASNAGAQARVVLSRSGASFARPQSLVRRAAPSARIDFEMYLGLKDGAGAEALLKQVSDPSSPSYGHYLSPDQFRGRFARPQSDVDIVAAWLGSQGFTVGDVQQNHLTVPASGTAAQVNRAFDVTLGYYRTNGLVRRAPDRAPSIPASLGSVVQGVIGLTPAAAHRDAVPPPPAFRAGRPCSTFWAERMATNVPPAYHRVQPRAVCGYSPAQMQGAYGVADAIANGTDGSGVTVAVVDAYASPTMQADLDRYSQLHGLPQSTIDQHTLPPSFGGPAMQQGWWGEESMDLEAVHGMAPGADLLFWGAASQSDHDLRFAIADILDNASADIITNSWGIRYEQERASRTDVFHDLAIQAGNEGIGMYFSSGDDGDGRRVAGFRTVELPAADPLVTAVGGTSIGVGALNSYLFETAWGTAASSLGPYGWGHTGYFYGGGGGTSRIFAEPDYQQGVVPPALAQHWGAANRVVPDISMNGDPNTGYLVGETQTFPDGSVRYGEYRLGGTSLSSPLFAGFMALADDAAGFSHGFANPVLYALNGTDALRDIVNPRVTIAVVRTNFNNGVDSKGGISYSLRTMNQTGSLHARVGYDDATGIGSPNGQNFLDALS